MVEEEDKIKEVKVLAQHLGLINKVNLVDVRQEEAEIELNDKMYIYVYIYMSLILNTIVILFKYFKLSIGYICIFNYFSFKIYACIFASTADLIIDKIVNYLCGYYFVH